MNQANTPNFVLNPGDQHASLDVSTNFLNGIDMSHTYITPTEVADPFGLNQAKPDFSQVNAALKGDKPAIAPTVTPTSEFHVTAPTAEHVELEEALRHATAAAKMAVESSVIMQGLKARDEEQRVVVAQESALDREIKQFLIDEAEKKAKVTA